MIGQGLAFAPHEEKTQAMRLRDLLGGVKTVISGAFRQYYWVVAEISSVSRSSAGHYYFELIDPGADGRAVAAVHANLWAGKAAYVVPRFKEVTKQTFQKGMELMLQVKVDMHIQYGLSLTINDINPEFTLGNLERKREATIKKLQEDGVFDLQQQFRLPSLLLCVAVISSETAAGYGDFMTTIKQSGLEEFFSIKLFQATMQGVNTTMTVNTAFAKIFYFREDFDAVLIMRGGGSKQDLSAFDDYDLCSTIANFPLPVLTAIGHEQDTSIADMVAHARFKTPTALGEFLVGRFAEQLDRVVSLRDRLPKALYDRLREMSLRNSRILSRTQGLLSSLEKRNAQKLQELRQRTQEAVTGSLSASDAKIVAVRKGVATALAHGLDRDRSRLSHLSDRLPATLRKPYLEALNRGSVLGTRLQRRLRDLEAGNRRVLGAFSSKLSYRLTAVYSSDKACLPSLSHRLTRSALLAKEQNSHRLEELARRAKLLDPSRIMARGFIVAVNAQGDPVTRTDQLTEGDTLTLSLLDGKALAETKKILPNP